MFECSCAEYFGTQRIARHLWRMCFALFIACASIFLARQQVFPDAVAKDRHALLPEFPSLMLVIFWLIRVRLPHAFKGKVTGQAHA
jgi:hypothetical protein